MISSHRSERSGSSESEQCFGGAPRQAWRHLFAWLAARDGRRDDRPRSISADAFEVLDSGGDQALPLGVRLSLRWAGRDASTLCDIDPVAARHLATMVGLKWATLEEVARSSPRALACLVADTWSAKVGSGLLRWRVVDSTVRAIVTSDYSPINDLALNRVLEEPLVALGLAPVRGLRSDTETRIEFALGTTLARCTSQDAAEPVARGGANRPGLVLRNSETGHALISLAPALVRYSGVATRLMTPVVEFRHVVRDRDALARKLVEAAPSLLDAGRNACQLWNMIRRSPCTVVQRQGVERVLDDTLGRKTRETIMADFDLRASADRTPAGIYAAVAVATKGLPPRKRSETDPLLSELLRTAVVQTASRTHASAL